MTKFDQVVFSENQSVLPLAPTTPPLTSPFPVNLPNAGTVNLALVDVNAGCPRRGVLLTATVNWSATFTPPATTPPETLRQPGFADVTFEILLNGRVIYRVTQTAVQKDGPVNAAAAFITAVPTYVLAPLLFVDETPLFTNCLVNVYLLRATNVSLVAPQVSAGTATTTAAVGAVTLAAERVRTRRMGFTSAGFC